MAMHGDAFLHYLNRPTWESRLAWTPTLGLGVNATWVRLIRR